jgi:Tol biopolymer transport system component
MGLATVGLAPVLAGCTVPFTFGDERGVFVVDLNDQEPRRIAPGSPWVAWSTDSRQLALRDATGTIRVTNIDGTGTQPYSGGSFIGPGWSPSGTEIAVIDAEANVIRIETGGGAVIAQAPLREDMPELWEVATPANTIPVWAPDGNAIAFIAWNGNGDALYTISPAGTERRRLSDIRVSQNRVNRYDRLGQHVAEGDAGSPDWAPDSQFLAYALYPEVRGATGGVYVVAATGGWSSRVTDLVPTGGPAWSPDGRQIAYTAREGGRGSVFVATTNGGAVQNLTSTLNLNARDPAWSPDGLQLAFVAGGDLYVIAPDGSSQRLASTGLVIHDPLWSPDGTKIAFLGIPSQPGR